MANPVKWSDSKAGYDPGQKQELSVSFSSREIGKVTVSYKFYAKSLGRDDFVYNERHNKVTIWVGGTSKSFTYQLHGNKASTTKTGSFSITGVANGTTSLKVEYKNDRIWVNKPQASWSPRSTGVVSKKKIGDLTISDNVKCSITYNQAYKNGSIKNLPSNVTYYKGTSYKIPKNILTDNSNHYIFNKGYTTSNSLNINTSNPTKSLDSAQTLTGNVTYYACWTPQTYTYTFFNNSKYEYQYTELNKNYTYTKAAIDLPNLHTLTKNNSDISSKYYKVGYEFGGWDSQNGNIDVSNLKCSFDKDTKFYPRWNAIESKIIFDYNFDSYTREVPYTYDTDLNFSVALKNQSDEAKSNTMLRPGYKLVGWTYSKSISDIIYEPFKSPDVPFKFDVTTKVTYANSSFTNQDFKNFGLTLYAVWEYYTTVYVYNEGVWKLALPYVYIGNNTWNIALIYGYININPEQNPSWKL